MKLLINWEIKLKKLKASLIKKEAFFQIDSQIILPVDCFVILHPVMRIKMLLVLVFVRGLA